MAQIRRLMLTAALAAALTGAVAAPALAGVPVTLRDDLATEDGKVTLGDLFDDAGAAAEVVVASGQSGATLVLDAGRVQMLARAQGLDWANETGVRRLILKPGSAPPPTATRAVSRSGRAAPVLSYLHSLNAGDIVRAGDLAWSKTLVAGSDAPRDADAVIGMAARRPLREGSAVSLHDVSAPQAVRKDDIVAVTFTVDGISLTLQAKALESAAVGQPFTVINTASKKIIEVVASGPGQAVVGPQADQMRNAGRANPAFIASLR
jgi:flagella basal body P-ring formation protein FlgA